MVCVCDHTAARSVSHGEERLPPPLLPTASSCEASDKLVSVLAPTTSDRHWAHENLYRCFKQQCWQHKELLVLDSGLCPSPFFAQLSDTRVRYTHLPLGANVLELLADLRAFVEGMQTPPGGSNADDLEWRNGLAAAVKALDEAEHDHEWYELEDEGRESTLYASTVRRVLTLGSKRNWLCSQARGAIYAHFDDDDVYLPSYLSRMATALLGNGVELVKLSSWLHLDGECLWYCDPDDGVDVEGDDNDDNDDDDDEEEEEGEGRDLEALARMDPFALAAGMPAESMAESPTAVPCGRATSRRATRQRATIGWDDSSGRTARKSLRGKNRHGLRWGYGFSFVYTPRLAARCPFEPINCSEDYGMVLDAAEKGLRCLAFRSAVGDALAVHVSHGRGNSSGVPFGRLLVGRSPAGLTSTDGEGKHCPCAGQWDECFAQPCAALVCAMLRDAAKDAQRHVVDDNATGSGARSTIAAYPMLRSHWDLEMSVAGVVSVAAAACAPPTRHHGRGQAAYKLQGF